MRPRLTYANVVATLALFIALGGTSIAAISLSKNSVKSATIKDGQVKTADLADNGVTSDKVTDGTLTTADFASGQLLVGPQGARGDIGARGADGVQGQPGADGTQGVAGPTGPTGAPGATGPAGPSNAGSTGPAGPQGESGATGPPGPQGAKGDPGDVGPTGPQGPTATPDRLIAKATVGNFLNVESSSPPGATAVQYFGDYGTTDVTLNTGNARLADCDVSVIPFGFFAGSFARVKVLASNVARVTLANLPNFYFGGGYFKIAADCPIVETPVPPVLGGNPSGSRVSLRTAVSAAFPRLTALNRTCRAKRGKNRFAFVRAKESGRAVTALFRSHDRGSWKSIAKNGNVTSIVEPGQRAAVRKRAERMAAACT